MSENLAKLITKNSIEKALPLLRLDKDKLKPSTTYMVRIDGESFPPKEVVRYAAREMGLNPDDFSLYGGPRTNKYLSDLGYEIYDHTISAEHPFAVKVWNYLSNEEWFYDNFLQRGLIELKRKPQDSKTISFYVLNDRVEISNGKTYDDFKRKYLRNNLKKSGENALVVISLNDQHDVIKLRFIGDDFAQENNFLGLKPYEGSDHRTLKISRISGKKSMKPYLNNSDSILSRLMSSYSSFVRAFFEEEDSSTYTKETTNNIIKKHMTYSKNQIFYGPPGTGKTYNTKNKALEIILGSGFNKDASRKDIKEQYDQLVESGQVVFTTFHQSLAYEDFIEGLKPKEENGKLNYAVEPGLFRLICEEASENYQLSNLNPDETKKDKAPFDRAFEYLKEKVQQALIENEPVTEDNNFQKGLRIELPSSFFSIVSIDGDSIKMMTRTGNEQNTMTRRTLKRIYDDLGSLKEVIRGGMSTYYGALVSFMIEGKEEIAEKAEKVELKKYVLIIDEINRGNVSQVFGELITLIEESKRQNESESLEVVLPYSKKAFSVPPNLYLIGTMNTADRSVEALDVALRRRFVFNQMLPEPSLVNSYGVLYRFWMKNFGKYGTDLESYQQYEEGIWELLGLEFQTEESKAAYVKYGDNLPSGFNLEDFKSRVSNWISFNGVDLEELLTVINERITYLKDEDHQIGHSYFMNVYSKDDLADTFNKNIIPLLQEYFYNDYGKIRLILGDGFVQKVEDAPAMAVNDQDEFLGSTRFKLREITSKNILEKVSSIIGV